jgi:hypothetical protein
MAYGSCGSKNQTEFGAEINVHFPGLKGLEKPAALAFPMLVVRIVCRFLEFTIAETVLRLLGMSAAARFKAAQ